MAIPAEPAPLMTALILRDVLFYEAMPVCKGPHPPDGGAVLVVVEDGDIATAL
jgi:hypothetical protein